MRSGQSHGRASERLQLGRLLISGEGGYRPRATAQRQPVIFPRAGARMTALLRCLLPRRQTYSVRKLQCTLDCLEAWLVADRIEERVDSQVSQVVLTVR